MNKASNDFKTTVVMATHNPQIADYGNRHFEIRDGKATPRGN
jgi:ABC-type lipoprotein export system ATPase subunit